MAFFHSTPSFAGELQKTNQTHRVPQLENKNVRVWKTTISPEQPLKLHRHDNNRVIVVLKGGKLDILDEQGKVTKTYDWQTGKAYWLDADPIGELHGDRNISGSPIEVMVIEVK
ncbi:hypothetical protein ACEUAY_21205 [Aeromonas veronii]